MEIFVYWAVSGALLTAFIFRIANRRDDALGIPASERASPEIKAACYIGTPLIGPGAIAPLVWMLMQRKGR